MLTQHHAKSVLSFAIAQTAIKTALAKLRKGHRQTVKGQATPAKDSSSLGVLHLCDNPPVRLNTDSEAALQLPPLSEALNHADHNLLLGLMQIRSDTEHSPEDGHWRIERNTDSLASAVLSAICTSFTLAMLTGSVELLCIEWILIYEPAIRVHCRAMLDKSGTRRIDEAAALHQAAGKPESRSIHTQRKSYYSWVLVIVSDASSFDIALTI